MRWSLRHEPTIKWYAFMDDDMFLRAPALIAFLSGATEDPRTERVAVGANPSMRGFAPAMWSRMAEQGCDSNNLCVFAFPWMQPAFFSKAALDAFGPALDVGGLTAECKVFSVTHDVGLGILNWMHQTPTLSLGKPYATNSDALKQPVGNPNVSPVRKSQLLEQPVTIHNVRRHRAETTIGHLSGASGEDGRHVTFAAIERAFGDPALTTLYDKSVAAGLKLAKALRPRPLNGFNSTLKGRVQHVLAAKRRQDFNSTSKSSTLQAYVDELNANFTSVGAFVSPAPFSVFTPKDCNVVDFVHAKHFCRSKFDSPNRATFDFAWTNVTLDEDTQRFTLAPSVLRRRSPPPPKRPARIRRQKRRRRRRRRLEEEQLDRVDLLASAMILVVP